MIIVKKAKPEDLDAILELQYAAYQSEALLYNNFSIQPLTQTLDELTAEYHKGVILKAVDNGKIIGSVRAYADGDTVYIGKLIVHPDHQGKGSGKRLLAAVENELHRKRFELFTGFKSERNLHLYEKAGYTRIHETTTDDGITFVYLEKQYEDSMNIAVGIPIGLVIGAIIGIMLDDIGLWIPVGLCIGIAVGAALPRKKPIRGKGIKNEGNRARK